MAAKPTRKSIDLAADLDLETRIVNFLYCRAAGPSVQLEVQNGTVIIAGKVPSAHAKWLCIECCRHVAGVVKLVDHMQVDAA